MTLDDALAHRCRERLLDLDEELETKQIALGSVVPDGTLMDLTPERLAQIRRHIETCLAILARQAQ